jgi:glycosyltransferase involved in cell wall biosynthesis
MTRAIRRWAAALASAGARSAIAADVAVQPGDDDVAWIRVDHVRVGGHWLPRNLRAALKRVDVLVLHGGWTIHNVIAARDALACGVPYILEPRGAYDPHIVARRRAAKRAWWLVSERRVATGARAIHVFDESEAPHLAALDLNRPLVVAPNGVDAPDQPSWDGGSGGFILWYGRFDAEHKGLDLLLDGLAALPAARRRPLRLHGPDRRGDLPRLRARARRLEIEDWVTFGGPVYGAHKEALLAACTAFVYPSRWEGFGIAPSEAVTRGVPLLATPYPFARALAERGGAIVVPATVAGLAEGLDRLAANDVRGIAAAGRRAAAAAFRWEDVARRWLATVESLL